MSILVLVQKVIRTSIEVAVCSLDVEKYGGWITILITVLVKSVNFGMSGNRQTHLRKSTYKRKTRTTNYQAKCGAERNLLSEVRRKCNQKLKHLKLQNYNYNDGQC